MNVSVSKEVFVTAEWKLMDLLGLLSVSDLGHVYSVILPSVPYSVILPLCSAIFSA